jgi:predicted ester cyclase
MSTEANKAIVRRFFEEYGNQRKLETLGDYVSPERLHHFGKRAEAHGFDQMRSMNTLWYSAAPDFEYHVEKLIGEGDRIATLVSFTGTQTGTQHVAGRSLPPSNRSFSVAEMFVFRIAVDKIVESRAVRDRLSLLEQLGEIAIPT